MVWIGLVVSCLESFGSETFLFRMEVFDLDLDLEQVVASSFALIFVQLVDQRVQSLRISLEVVHAVEEVEDLCQDQAALGAMESFDRHEKVEDDPWDPRQRSHQSL